MSFRIPGFHALLLAGMALGLLPAANAQSAGGGQHIVFSSPEGQISSNAPLPMVQAPVARETPDLPAWGGTVHEFSDPLAAPMFPQPLPMLQPPNAQNQNQDGFQDSMDTRKLTGSRIMDIPTAEQIFGLPEKKATDAQTEPWQLDSNSQNGATNNPTFDTTALTAEPSWARTWSGTAGKTAQSSNTTDKASGFFGRFFDSGPNDSVFGNHDANGEETFFGPSQPAQQQSSWDSGIATSAFGPSTPEAESANSFATPASSSPELVSQSPFATPQVATMDTLPRLPSLPSVQGQNNQFTPPSSSAPSWAPKPPPWTQSQTPFGTPVPLNPALKR